MFIKQGLVVLLLVPVALASRASATQCTPEDQSAALEAHLEKVEEDYCEHWLYDCECVSGLLPDALGQFQQEIVASFERGCASDDSATALQHGRDLHRDHPLRKGNHYFLNPLNAALLRGLGFSVEAGAFGSLQIGPDVTPCAVSERLASSAAETLECLAAVAFSVDVLSSELAESTTCRSREKARHRAEGLCMTGEDCECIADKFSSTWVESPLKTSSRAIVSTMSRARLDCR